MHVSLWAEWALHTQLDFSAQMFIFLSNAKWLKFPSSLVSVWRSQKGLMFWLALLAFPACFLPPLHPLVPPNFSVILNDWPLHSTVSLNTLFLHVKHLSFPCFSQSSVIFPIVSSSWGSINHLFLCFPRGLSVSFFHVCLSCHLSYLFMFFWLFLFSTELALEKLSWVEELCTS